MTDYDAIKCPMKGCDEDLYMEVTSCTPIMVGSTVEDLADPASAWTQTWKVRCVGGHVVVLPVDTAEDSYTFDADPEHADAARLSELTGWVAS